MGTRAYDGAMKVAMTALTVGHRTVNRLTGGRVGRRLGGATAVWLTTTGRRSGQPRRTPLVTARDGSAYLVAGSAGGREKPPDWSLNLAGHAERGESATLQVGDDHLVVDVEALDGAERDRCYALMVDMYRGFAAYERNATRTIPVFRLTPLFSSTL